MSNQDPLPTEHKRSKELRKAREILYAYPVKRKIGLVARKAFNLMLSEAMKHSADQEWYEMPIAQLAKDINFNSKDFKYLVRVLDEMQSTLLKWDGFEEIAGLQIRQLTSVQLLGKVRIIGHEGDGQVRGMAVRYKFDDEVKSKLFNPDVYAVISLELQQAFESVFTLAMYEQLVRFKGNIAKDGWSYTMQLHWTEWRTMILSGEPPKIYEQYKYFYRNVVKKALAELNIRDQLYEYEMCDPVKVGKRVEYLQFRMRSKKQAVLELDHELSELPLIDTDRIESILSACGISLVELDKLIRRYDYEALESAANALQERMSRKNLTPVKNPAAWITDHIKRSTTVEAPAKERVQPSAKAIESKPSNGESRSSSRGRASESTWAKIEPEISALTDEQRAGLIEQFMRANTDNLPLQSEAKKGFKSAIFRSNFALWYVDR